MVRNSWPACLLVCLTVFLAGCSSEREDPTFTPGTTSPTLDGPTPPADSTNLSGNDDKPTPSWEISGTLSRSNLSLNEDTTLHLTLRSLGNETARPFAVSIQPPPELALEEDPWWNGTAEPGQSNEAMFVLRAQAEGCGRLLAVGASFRAEVPFCVGEAVTTPPQPGKESGESSSRL